jgi:hypothetical protein
MKYAYGSGRDVGSFCHWCGEAVSHSTVRTGNHLFCRNGRKCQQAHARAFRKYTSRVTTTRISGADVAASSGPNGNANGAKPASPMPAAIAKDRSSHGNAKRQTLYEGFTEIPWQTKKKKRRGT